MLGLTTMKLFKDWVATSSSVDPLAKQNSEALIVGMSATALESEQEEGFVHGMHFFMPKPADLQILGLIISAKRGSHSNSEAIDSICAATGTIGEGPQDGGETVPNLLAGPGAGSGKGVELISEEEDEVIAQTAVIKKSAQWKLFRSFRQQQRIFPEAKN